MNDEATVPLSIVIGSIAGWPEVADNVRVTEAAADRVGAELIYVDGSGGPGPPAGALGPRTTWIEAPGDSVFQARLRGYATCRGDIVAVTEDHCFAPPDWCERMLAAHRAHPEAAAIGGAVENGATDTIIDWASFLVVQTAAMAPIRSGHAKRIAGAVNVSYKRRALENILDHEGMGALDILHQRMLNQRGETLIADDGIRIAHDQSLGFRGTTAAHYHAGRTVTGARRQVMAPADWVRFGGAFVVPILRFGRILALGSRRGYLPRMIPAAPGIIWLLYSQAVGQFVGYLRGPGDSAAKVP